jgi:nicotinate-nucleotide--dimethylbenzimidazole phosphoribosyltransferase
MERWIICSQAIQPTDKAWAQKARQRLNSQTRPQGSLGDLENMIAKFVAVQQKDCPRLEKKRILIFAADHGVEREGVSLYPREVTRAMVMNFLNGGATINALARQINAEVRVIDVGVDADFADHASLIQAKVGRGTKNFKLEPAMSVEELNKALETGWRVVKEAKNDNVDLLVVGEMGIANTTAAGAVIAACLKVQPALVTGRGTGLGQEGLRHKIQVIEESAARHAPYLDRPLNILRHVGGYEIAAMTGVILACAHYALPVVLDGVVVAAAALCAFQLNPAIADYIFIGHESEERAHRFVLEKIGQKPLLRLSMRLGEASGAALAVSLLEAGVRIYNEVATFEEARVAGQKEPVPHP